VRADGGGRTRDLRLGEPTLYQLSYVRDGFLNRPAPISPRLAMPGNKEVSATTPGMKIALRPSSASGAVVSVAGTGTGAFGRMQTGRPRLRDGLRARPTQWPPCDSRRVVAKVKSDKVDARTLCELLDAGFLPADWDPDEQTGALRRLLGRRERLVRSRTRATNAVHAALARNLKGRPAISDVFGREGRGWLARLELPAHERRIVESCLREVDFLSHEITALE
jgi:hypothetical protein